MRGAALRQETPAEGPDTGADLAGALAELRRVLRKISREPGSAAAVRELAETDVTLLEVRAAYVRHTAALGIAAEQVALGRQIERDQAARPVLPASRAAARPPLMRLV